MKYYFVNRFDRKKKWALSSKLNHASLPFSTKKLNDVDISIEFWIVVNKKHSFRLTLPDMTANSWHKNTHWLTMLSFLFFNKIIVLLCIGINIHLTKYIAREKLPGNRIGSFIIFLLVKFYFRLVLVICQI